MRTAQDRLIAVVASRRAVPFDRGRDTGGLGAPVGRDIEVERIGARSAVGTQGAVPAAADDHAAGIGAERVDDLLS